MKSGNCHHQHGFFCESIFQIPGVAYINHSGSHKNHIYKEKGQKAKQV
jgi:hypothetical protein